MKLIKKGISKSDPVIKGVCSNCKAEYEEVESKLTLKEYLMHDGVDYDGVDCPECYGHLSVDFIKEGYKG